MKPDDKKELHRYRVGNSMLAGASGACILIADLAKWINPAWYNYGATVGFISGLYLGWKSAKASQKKNDESV